MKHNCPNCGAPIEDVKCPYCGTILYDFAALDMDHATYVRLKIGEDVFTFHAVLGNTSVAMEPGSFPELTLILYAVPDENGVCFVEHRKSGEQK